MKHRRLFALLSLFACMLALTACGSDDDEASSSDTDGTRQGAIRANPDNASTTIRVGSKNSPSRTSSARSTPRA